MANKSEVRPATIAYFVVALALAIGFFSLTWQTGDDARYFAAAKALATGHGYVFEYMPGTPPETITPPGHPLILAGIMKIFGTGVAPGKVYGACMYVIACLLVLAWSRRQFPQDDVLALATAALGMFTIGLLTMSCWYMAEMSYMVFSFLALLLYEKWVGYLTPRRALLLGVVAAYAYLVRGVGLSLVAALGLSLIVHKKWRSAAWAGMGVALVAGPWSIRNMLVVGSVDMYVTQFSGMTGASAGESYPWLRVYKDISVAFPQYFVSDLPIAMFFQLMDGRNLLEKINLGFLAEPARYTFLTLIAFGFFKRLRLLRPLELYWIFYWLIICSPPFPPQGNWYVYPMLPIAALYLVTGVGAVFGLLRRALSPRGIVLGQRGVAVACAVYALTTACGAAAIHFYKELPRWKYSPWAPARYFFFKNGYMESFGRMIDAGQWIASNLPPDTVIVSRQPQHLHIVTGHQGWRYDLPEIPGSNLWLRMQGVGSKRPVALIEDAFTSTPGATFSYGVAHWALRELFAAHSNELTVIHETATPVTRVWILKEQAASLYP